MRRVLLVYTFCINNFFIEKIPIFAYKKISVIFVYCNKYITFAEWK